VAVAREEPHIGSVAPRHDAEAVMLDLHTVPLSIHLQPHRRQALQDTFIELVLAKAGY
jgi:hypothetical protein